MDALKKTFFDFGHPKTIVSDTGKQLISKEVEAFLTDLEISHYQIALYLPKQNGLVERFNRVLSEKIKEAIKFDWNVLKMIEHILFNCRSTPHNTTRVALFEALFGRKMKNILTSLASEGVLRGTTINQVCISKWINIKKQRHDRSRQATVPTLKSEDLIRIIRPDGTFRNPHPFRELTTTSIILMNGQKWSLERVGSKITADLVPKLKTEIPSPQYLKASINRRNILPPRLKRSNDFSKRALLAPCSSWVFPKSRSTKVLLLFGNFKE